MIKNILAAIGAVTVGAIALGAVIGRSAITTADDDDFDVEKDLRKARDYCRKKAEELDEEDDNDEEDEDEPQMPAIVVIEVHANKDEPKDEDAPADKQDKQDEPADKAEDSPAEDAKEKPAQPTADEEPDAE